MADSPSPSLPQIGLAGTSINISEGSREGVINVLFKRDPKIPDWLLNTFYDSHAIFSGSEENPRIDSVPNSTFYQCPTCKAKKSTETNLTKAGYLICNGTEKRPHKPSSTYPLEWKPILKKAGLYYLLGQVNSSLNTNIATANLSVSDLDLKRKLSLEDRMRYIAWFLSYSMIAVIAGQYPSYVADWVIKENQLHVVFSVGFTTNFIVNMANNILANSTKGKGMAAAGRAMDTHVSTEAQTHHEIDYQYPQGALNYQRKSVGDKLGDIFNFNK